MAKTADIKVRVVRLNDLAAEANETAVKRGWWSARGAGAPYSQHDPTFIEACMLVCTEVSEAVEAFRDGAEINHMGWDYIFDAEPTCGWEADSSKVGLRYRCKHTEMEWRDLTAEVVWAHDGTCKPTGIPTELADIIIRVLDICGAWGVDIQMALRVKMDYNVTRPARHGGKRA